MFYNPIHVVFLLAVFFGFPVTSYFIGKKVGDASGYARGYREGREAPR